jgi:hypothetical protein
MKKTEEFNQDKTQNTLLRSEKLGEELKVVAQEDKKPLSNASS